MNIDELFISNKLPEPLSNKQVNELFEKLKNGDYEVREKIIEHNIKLVLNQVLKRFKTVEYDKKELVSIGIFGLIKAVDSFNTEKEVKFSSYAIRCIDNEILMFLRKIKKIQNVDNLDRSVYTNNDGSEISLGEMIPCDTNIESDYTDNEIYQFIRKNVESLPNRDKEMVKLYFGFYDRKHTQQEIADKFGISRSYVARLVQKAVSQLGNQLEEIGLIEKQGYENNVKSKTNIIDNSIKKEGMVKMSKKLQSIYEYFNKYSKEEIDSMLTKLTDEEKELISLRYGDDLNNPITSEKWDKNYNNKFYGSLIRRMKRLLANPNNIPKSRIKPKSDDNMSMVIPQNETSVVKPITSEKPVKNEEIIKLAQVEKKQIPASDKNVKNETMVKEDYMKILEILKTPNFKKMLNSYSPTESIIISLKLGYINDKYFSTEEIANFLGVNSDEVTNITRKILLEYKKRINQVIDEAIRIATENPTINTGVQVKNLNR